MHKLIALFLSLIVFWSCKQNGKPGKTESANEDVYDTAFTIDIYMDGVPRDTKFVLTYLGIERPPDTAVFRQDKFQIKGKTTEPLMAQLSFLNSLNKLNVPLLLMVENAYINVEGRKDSFQNSKVIGGLQNTDFGGFKKILKLYWDSVNVLASKEQQLLLTKDTARVLAVKAEHEHMEKETRSAVAQYAVEHSTSIASAYYTLEYVNDIPISLLDSIYNSYDSSIKNSYYVSKIKNVLDVANRTGIGHMAPELSVNNNEFDTITISSNRGKYLLIDFWASWSVPSKKEHNSLVKLYYKYKPKGFEILGVSLDSSKSDWQKAVKTDKLAWKNVSDLKGWKSSVVSLYGLQTIPYNILVDRGGKIIAKNLSMQELDERLGNALQGSR